MSDKENENDKSLDELLAELGANDDSKSSSDTPASDETSLDDLLKSLGGDDSASSKPDADASSGSDSSLDDLLKSLGGGDTPADTPLPDLSDLPGQSEPSDSAFGDAPGDTPAPAAPPREAPKASTGAKPALTATLGIRSAPKAHPGSRQPLVIALIGDFTGRNSRPPEPLAGRKGHLVDLDSHDGLYEKLSPTLSLEDPGAPGSKIELTFNELDDFHPDQFCKKFPGIQNLRALRPQLLATASLAKAAAQLQKLLGTPLPKAPPRSSAARAGETTEQTLERLLKKPAPKTAALPKKSAAAQAVDALLKQAVADNVVKNPTPHQKNLVAALDAACAVRLRAILSNPRFQALESAWRSVDMLVRLFDDGDRIKLLVYDVSKEEIALDLAKNGDNPAETGLNKMIRDTIAENPWMAAFCMHTIGDSPDDLARAATLAAVFAANQTPIIAAGHPFALGCANFATQPDPDDWTKTKDTEIGAALKALRENPAANHLALAMPRVLMRLPYGKTTDPIAPFPFEEIESPDQFEQYLWASPAVLVARLYIERFKQKGWTMDLAAGETLGDIPVFHFKQNGESTMIPCAEAWLTERAAVAITNAGFIPMLSVKNSGTIRVGRINSIAADNAPLALRVPKS